MGIGMVEVAIFKMVVIIIIVIILMMMAVTLEEIEEVFEMILEAMIGTVIF